MHAGSQDMAGSGDAASQASMQQTLMLQQLAQRGLNQQQLQQVLQSHALQNILGPGALPTPKTLAFCMIFQVALDILASLFFKIHCSLDHKGLA